jgi:hypothetical protein
MKQGLLSLTLLVVSGGFAGAQTPIFTENYEGGGLGVYTETDIGGNPAATLWHGENECSAGVPVSASFGTNAAAYNQGDVGNFTYNTGAANEGAIETPLIVPAGGCLSLSFDYTKDTEGGGTNTFDQCFVESKPVGGAWGVELQVPGISPCGTPTSVTGLGLANVPTGSSFQQRFFFDSVDSVSNNYAGWYVDNVVITETAGGGTFSPLFTENFEGAGLGIFVETDIAGTSVATLWHGEGSCDVGVSLAAVMQTKAAAYNQGDIGLYNFDTGGPNEGAIESPALPIGAPIGTLRLTFDYSKDTENSLAFDQCFVEVSPGAGGGWSMVNQLPAALVDCASSPTSYQVGPCSSLNALVPAGGGKFRFFFDTVDGVANTGHGWYVDNVLLEGAAPGGNFTFGSGCAGTGGVVPTIGANSPPMVPNLGYAVTLSGALPGTAAVLVVGFSDTMWLAFPLPLNLAFVLAPACFLNVSVDIQIPTATSGAGTASQLLPIPPLPGLVGASLYSQWGVIDPGAAGPLPLAMSKGLRTLMF